MRQVYGSSKYVNEHMKEKKSSKTLCYITIAILLVVCFYQYYSSLRKSIQMEDLVSQNKTLSNELQQKELALSNLDKHYKELIDNYENKLKVAEYNHEYQVKVISDLKATNDELDKELESIAKKNKKLNKVIKEDENTIADLADRVNTYEKYDYALYYGNKRNDLTYEQLKLGEELMKEKGYDPDLLFGIIMVESRGLADAVNPSSNATGYGQFLYGTGKYIYENVLHEDVYNHNTTPKNGTTNIKMMAAYLDLLYNKYNGDIVKTIKEYCGSSNYAKTYSYMNKINTHIDSNVYNMSVKK